MVIIEGKYLYRMKNNVPSMNYYQQPDYPEQNNGEDYWNNGYERDPRPPDLAPLLGLVVLIVGGAVVVGLLGALLSSK